MERDEVLAVARQLAERVEERERRLRRLQAERFDQQRAELSFEVRHVVGLAIAPAKRPLDASVLDHARSQPFQDQADEPFISDPMPYEFFQMAMLHFVEE